MAETKCTPEMMETIFNYIRAGLSDKDTCNLVGIDYGTFYNWIKWGEEGTEPYSSFSIGLSRARPGFKAFHIDNINKLARASEKDDVKLRASQFMLERRFPDEFGKRDNVKISGDENNPLRMAIDVAAKLPETEADWVAEIEAEDVKKIEDLKDKDGAK